MTLEEIRKHSQTDKHIIAIQHALTSGKWYDNPLLSSYKDIKADFSDVNGITLRGDQILLPESLWKRALEIVHEGHLGRRKVVEKFVVKECMKHIYMIFYILTFNLFMI